MAVILDENGVFWSANNTRMSSRRSIFPTNTLWCFFQSTTPTGWTRTSTSTNNSTLRVVSTANDAGSNAGISPFTTIFSNSSQIFNVNTSTYGSGFATLSVSQIPTHTHTFSGQTIQERNAKNPAGEFIEGNLARSSGTGVQPGGQTQTAGTGGSHNHDIFVGNTITVTLPLAVKYIDVFFAFFNG
jgi:hypothetical protein